MSANRWACARPTSGRRGRLTCGVFEASTPFRENPVNGSTATSLDVLDLVAVGVDEPP